METQVGEQRSALLSQEPLLPRNIPRLWILVLHVAEPSEQIFLWFWPRPNNLLPDIPRHYLGATISNLAFYMWLPRRVRILTTQMSAIPCQLVLVPVRSPKNIQSLPFQIWSCEDIAQTSLLRLLVYLKGSRMNLKGQDISVLFWKQIEDWGLQT